MKKLFSLFVILFISLFTLTAQSDGYRGQRKSFENVDCRVESVSFSNSDGSKVLNIYFSSAVDPRSLSSGNILIDGSPASGARISFNRAGTQARVTISKAPPFSLRIVNVRSFDGKSVPSYSRKF